MKIKITEKIQQFLNSKKDYPVLAAFSVGYYSFVFYFSNNFDLVNSWTQFFYFLSYFILVPIVVFFVLERIITKTRFSELLPQLFTILMVPLLVFYIVDDYNFFVSVKRISLFIFIVFCIWKFKIRIYKYLIVLVALASVIPTVSFGFVLFDNLTHSNHWLDQPDNILTTRFVKKPNIYYIQPDGYANEKNLKDSLYHFDNFDFDAFLKENKFTSYDFRSNYSSTLNSNSSCFAMKHHFINGFSGFLNPRDIIIGKNPVLQILKENDYHTSFISERPYLLMNRPTVYYDYYNFQDRGFTHHRDGWSDFHEITSEIEEKIKLNKKLNNFFFVRKFDPSHISVSAYKGVTVKKERDTYISKLQIANIWLKKIIKNIVKNDPNAIIIIGADHAGFVGFESTMDVVKKKVVDQKLLNSIFGTKLAIKWNDEKHVEFDKDLKTSVNLFRVLFSYLSEDKALLKNLQPDISYLYLKSNTGEITPYPALDRNGNLYHSK